MISTRVAIVILFVTLDNSYGQLNNPGRAPSLGRIISYSSTNNGANGYSFSYETDDGTKRQEQGGFVEGIWTVTGSYAWFSPDGRRHEVNFKADDKGYRLLPSVYREPSHPIVPVPATFRGLGVGSLSSLAGVG